MPIFAYFQIPCFHPKTWPILQAVWRLHELGSKSVSLGRFKILRPLLSITMEFILAVLLCQSACNCANFHSFLLYLPSIFFPFNKPFKLPTNASVPFCSIIFISISLQYWSTSSDLVLKSHTTEKLGHSKKVSGAKNESRQGSFVPWFIIK